MRTIVSANSLATQTEPEPAVTPSGPSPTEIVAVTRSVTASICDTVPSREFATQSEPSSKAIPVGPLPTLTVRTISPPSASTRITRRVE
jgi:hypothetical protein